MLQENKEFENRHQPSLKFYSITKDLDNKRIFHELAFQEDNLIANSVYLHAASK